MRIIAIIYILILPLAGFSQLQVSAIDKSLLYKAGAVVRNSETTIEVVSKQLVIIKVKKSITVLNKSGEDEANVVVWYDKTRKIKSITGAIYNETGFQVKKFSKKDFSDVSAANDFSLYEDSRLKFLRPGMLAFPFTIEYEYEVHSKQSLAFSDWVPLYSEGTSLEKASLSVIRPADFKFRFKELNFQGHKQEEILQNKKIISKWTVRDIKAFVNEPYSPDRESYLTVIKMAPNDFYYGDVKGSFSDWNEFGKWFTEELLAGRDKLPESTINQVKELVIGIDDPKEKAKKIYEYMQQKTRYVSVQIGIGGFQPYPAAEVDRLGYGDCKGLVNYTSALLNAVGIESYYSIVNAGRFKDDMVHDFASINDGNHIILCLPLQNDTVWLECTNKKSPFGYLGDFTDDRLVLVCTKDGGRLARTPKLDMDVNKQTRKAKFKIDSEGDLTGSIHTIFEGIQYNNHGALAGESFPEQEKLLTRWYPVPNLKVISLEYLQDKKELPVSTEFVNIRSGNYAAVSRTEMVIPMNLLNKKETVPKEVRNRHNPVYINRGYTDYDEFIYEIPEGFIVDSFTKNYTVEKPFGSYESKISITGNIITYTRFLQLKGGLYPADLYADLVNFFQIVKDGDLSKVTVLKKDYFSGIH